MKTVISLLVLLFLATSCGGASAHRVDDDQNLQTIKAPQIVTCKKGSGGVEMNICNTARDGYVPLWGLLFFKGSWKTAEFIVVSTRATFQHSDFIEGEGMTGFDFLVWESLPEENFAVKVRLEGPRGVTYTRFIVRTKFQRQGTKELPVDDPSWGW